MTLGSYIYIDTNHNDCDIGVYLKGVHLFLNTIIVSRFWNIYVVLKSITRFNFSLHYLAFFTCVAPMKILFDSNEWKYQFHSLNNLTEFRKKYIENAIIKYSNGLILYSWLEVRKNNLKLAFESFKSNNGLFYSLRRYEN